MAAEKYPLNPILTPLNREERLQILENWQRITRYLNNLQHQLKMLAGGKEVDEILNQIETSIENAEAATEITLEVLVEVSSGLSQLSTALSNSSAAAGAANTATTQANTARDTANNAASDANMAKTNAEASTSSANNATSAANAAKTAADTATSAANTARDTANNAASAANTAKDNANTATASANNAIATALQSITDINLLINNEIWRGTYSASGTYLKGNKVYYNKDSFVALKTNVGITPTNDGVNWRLVARGGIDGQGAVNTVNGLSPEENGDVILAAESISFESTNVKEALEENATNLTEVDDRLTTQLAQNTAKLQSNAPFPLPIETYDGSGQTVHPSVLYFPDKFLDWEHWMAHTPYPNTNDDYENPSVLVSIDGVSWVKFAGATNPIDMPTAEQTADGYFMSDTHLVRVGDTLECWYRLSNQDYSHEQILRKKTTDGKTWSTREVVYDTSNQRLTMSPTVHYKNGQYIMWFVSNGKIWRTTSTTGAVGTWSSEIEVSVQFKDTTYTVWHISVFDDSDRLILIFNSVDRKLLFGESIDGGLSFTNTRLVLEPSKNAYAWDSFYIYRADMCKIGGIYRLYYSAYSKTGRWNIGAIEGASIDTLRAFDYINFYGQDVKTNMLLSRLRLGSIRDGSYLTNREILFREDGVSSAKLRNISSSIIAVQKENGDLGTFRADILYPNFLQMAEVTTAPSAVPYLSNNELKFLTSGVKAVKLRNTAANTLAVTKEDNTLGIFRAQRVEVEDAYVQFLRLLETETVLTSQPFLTNTILQLFKTGVGVVRMQLDGNKGVKVTNENNSLTSLKANLLILDDGAGTATEGAIRYNKTTKKHQGYDGATWHDLY